MTSYQIEDLVYEPITYYRLTSVDLDGSRVVFPSIVVVKRQMDDSIYYDPLSNSLNISGATDKKSIIIYNSIGQIIFRKELQSENFVQIGNLVPGAYFVHYDTQHGRKLSKFCI